jgi:hypothetical protein
MKLEIASVSEDISRLKPQQEAQISGTCIVYVHRLFFLIYLCCL